MQSKYLQCRFFIDKIPCIIFKGIFPPIFLTDSDKEDLNKETLEKQYKIVKRETNTSMVCQFGDLSISKMKVADFQGEITQKDTFFSLISDMAPLKKYSYFTTTK